MCWPLSLCSLGCVTSGAQQFGGAGPPPHLSCVYVCVCVWVGMPVRVRVNAVLMHDLRWFATSTRFVGNNVKLSNIPFAGLAVQTLCVGAVP